LDTSEVYDTSVLSYALLQAAGPVRSPFGGVSAFGESGAGRPYPE